MTVKQKQAGEWFGENKGVGSRFQRAPFAERMDAVERAGILSFRSMKSLQPARQLILVVRAYMTPHEIDLRFAAEIARMKKLTIEKDRRDGLGFLAVAVAGLVAAGVALWFGGGDLGLSFGVGMLVSVIGFVIFRVSTDHNRPTSYCPRCSYCWGVAEYENEWLKWNCCPSCGLKVNDGAEAKEWP